MTEPNRQLAAIMFTDLKGYTALTERNEPAALELVKKNRDLHMAAIEKYGGRLLKEMGDGNLATFRNSVDAIHCAMDIQHDAKAHNFDIPVRIGIHFGDITVDHEDIFGHGVNMASRIQSIADPGGIYLSESIKKQIRENDGIETQYMGAVPLKNINDPVPVYALKGNGLPPPEKRRIERIIRKAIYLKYSRNAAIAVMLILSAAFIWFIRTYDIEKEVIAKSVAVLPLENLSEDPELEYVSNGMTDELIRELSKVSALTVISQRATRQYAGIAKPFSEISRELNEVNYIVDGNVKLEQEKIITNISLIDPIEDQVMWSQKYEREISATRQLWAQVAQDIIRIIGIFVPEENTALWTGVRPVDPESYALYLKGMYSISKTPPDIEKGVSYFNEAIDRNPADAYAYAGLSAAYIYYGHSPTPTNDVRQKCKAAALRAIQLDSTLAEAWSVLGMVKAYYEWDWEAAEQAYHRANTLNPSIPWNHYHYSWYLVLFGRMNEAIEEHKRAKELDPFAPPFSAWLGYIYMMVGEYDKAIRECKLAMTMKNKFLGTMVLADTYITMGREEEAIEIYEQLAKDYSQPRYNFLGTAYVKSGNIEEGKKILHDLETKYDTIPSGWGALKRAHIYTALGDYDSAFKWWNFEPHHHFAPWVRVGFVLPYVSDSSFIKDPRFKALMRRMNLPDPAPFQYDPGLDL